jgi:hypothetical protein
MRQRYRIVILGVALVFATVAFAQNDQKVAPTAPKSEMDDKTSGPSQGQANICAELGAYAKAMEEKQQQAAQQTPPAPPAPEAQKGDDKKSNVDKPQQDSGITKPVPNDGAKDGPKMAPSELRLIAEKDDRGACRSTVNRLRRAGTALPPALIALAALKTDR